VGVVSRETGTGRMAMVANETAADQSPAVVERINVALAAEAAESLDKLQSRTRMKKVDVVNRALRLYEFIDAEIRAGNRLLIRDENEKDYLVKLFF
jgi:hypothetical protein